MLVPARLCWPLTQVERHTGEQYFKKLSLTECLKISQQRCALFFRKVEIRQTRGEELARVLSLLEELWLSGAGSSTSGGSRSRGKRKRGGRARSGSKVRLGRTKGQLGSGTAGRAAGTTPS